MDIRIWCHGQVKSIWMGRRTRYINNNWMTMSICRWNMMLMWSENRLVKNIVNMVVEFRGTTNVCSRWVRMTIHRMRMTIYNVMMRHEFGI